MSDHSGNLTPPATICLPAFNERELIGPLLSAIKSEMEVCPTIRQVLVETSGSTDGTDAVVREWSLNWPECLLLDGKARGGLASSIARMVGRAETEVIVRIDADVKIRTGTIKALVECMKDETVGIVGPRIVPERSENELLDRLVGTEYLLHHLVSMLSPKVTNVQVFRRFDAAIPSDIETEDILIQDLATSNGRHPRYVGDETVWIVPPSSVTKLFRQRVRCVASAKWYRSRTKRLRTSTHKLSVVIPAILEALRSRELKIRDLVPYLPFELVAHAYARLASALTGHADRSIWPSDRGSPAGLTTET